MAVNIDTVEVRSSSLLVPTIFLYHLTSLTSLRQAPNGSIKRAEPRRMFHTSPKKTSGESGVALLRVGRFTSSWRAVPSPDAGRLRGSNLPHAGLIGIGAAVTRRPLPHHRAYGSVHGGSSGLR